VPAWRSFRAGITYMGFYTQGMIKPEIARIRHREDEVRFTQAEAAARRAGPETDQLVGPGYRCFAARGSLAGGHTRAGVPAVGSR